MDRYFFAQDGDCHWYMIPEKLKEQWRSMSNIHDDDEDGHDALNEIFSPFLVGGSIESITFENPSRK